jgi:hypothetical protein
MVRIAVGSLIYGDGRPATHELLWAGFWPRRTQCAGRFGGPTIGCWTTGPDGRKAGGMGRIDVWAGYKVMNSKVYILIKDVLEAIFELILYIFDEFHLDFDFYSKLNQPDICVEIEM